MKRVEPRPWMNRHEIKPGAGDILAGDRGTRMSELTVLFTTFRRHEYADRCLDMLARQTADLTLTVIDNEGLGWFRSNPHIDRLVEIPWDAGPFMVFPFALYAPSEWVMLIQDDVLIKDTEFAQDALRIAKERPASITGAFGRKVSFEPPHYVEDGTGNVGIIKSQFAIFRKALLYEVKFPELLADPGVNVPWIQEDIWFSLAIGKGKPVHWADRGLRKRLERLEVERAYSREPGHWDRREEACRRYMWELAE